MGAVADVACLFLTERGAFIRLLPWPPPAVLRDVIAIPPTIRTLVPLPAKEQVRTFRRTDPNIYVEEEAWR